MIVINGDKVLNNVRDDSFDNNLNPFLVHLQMGNILCRESPRRVYVKSPVNGSNTASGSIYGQQVRNHLKMFVIKVNECFFISKFIPTH